MQTPEELLNRNVFQRNAGRVLHPLWLPLLLAALVFSFNVCRRIAAINPADPPAGIAAVDREFPRFHAALAAFEKDTGRFPTTAEGLDALVHPPKGLSTWQGPYLSKIPDDPWSSPYHYQFPAARSGDAYDLQSNGHDRTRGTFDDVFSN